jgi:hypothetical protein
MLFDSIPARIATMPALKGVRPPNAGKGRPKGAANRVNRTLRDMILGALDDAGGQAYLAKQANENPVAFMTLLGRVLPREPLDMPPTRITLDFGYRKAPPVIDHVPALAPPGSNGFERERLEEAAEILHDTDEDEDT